MNKDPFVLRKRILLAESEPSVRGAINAALRLDEHTVIEAGNPGELLRLCASDQFDLLIVDADFDKSGERSTLAAIRRVAPSQRVLLITANLASRFPEKDHQELILDKPFTLARLRQAISELLK